MNAQDPHRYDDIIGLPRPVSPTRPHMSMEERAAQFSPFAALTGFGAVIQESGRVTQEREELDEDELARLNEVFLLLKENVQRHPMVCVTYFEADDKKAGGAYRTAEGRLRKIDEYTGVLVLEPDFMIPLANLCEIALKEAEEE